MIHAKSELTSPDLQGLTGIEDLKDSFTKLGLEEENALGDNNTDSTEEHSMDGSISSGSQNSHESSEQENMLVLSVSPQNRDQPKQPLKPAIKHDILKDPPAVCVRRKSWKTLPVPDLAKIQQDSISSSIHSESTRRDAKIRRSSSSVSFKDVQIRDYDLTIGDNPSVSYGPPISLDWEYEERSPLCINEYESSRQPRRSLRQMGLNYYERINILSHTYGYSEEDLKLAKKETKKVKKQRSLTRALVKLHMVEDFVESAGRKAKRVISGGSPSKGNSQPVKEITRQASI
mmetsp:Transcript_26340/g.37103  ORF Transcript_26340/g.37103 Transcript_26340/m.37103 type:complete len:289 (+) Transcript_26340:172-1038(+)